MVSVAILLECNEEQVSRVERVSSVGETDGPSFLDDQYFNGCIGCWVGRSGDAQSDCRLSCSLVLITSMPLVGQIRTMIIILCVRRSRRGGCYGYSTSVRPGKEELIVFAFGLIGKFLDRTSSSAFGKNGIYLSLYGLSGRELFVIIIQDDIVILRNFKSITTMHIDHHVSIEAIVFFATRRGRVGVIIMISSIVYYQVKFEIASLPTII